MKTQSRMEINLPTRPSSLNKLAVPEVDRGQGKFNMAVGGDTTEVMLYGVVGWEECAAENIVPAIKAIKTSNIALSINSVGGDVFDAAAIYNTLQQHPAKVTVNIDGLAASAASVIAMAGDVVNIGKNAFMMIHNASSFAFGTGDDMRETAAILDKLSGSIAQTYADATGKPLADITALMDAETWFTGQEAMEAGFVDSVMGDDEDRPLMGATAKELKAFAKVPSKVMEAVTSTATRSKTFLNQTRTPKPKISLADSDDFFGDYWDLHPEIHNTFDNNRASYVRLMERSTPAKPVDLSATAEEEWDRHPECHDAWIDKKTFLAACKRDGLLKIAPPAMVNDKPRAKAEPEKPALVVAYEAEMAWANNIGNCKSKFITKSEFLEARAKATATANSEWASNANNCTSEFASKDIFIGSRRRELMSA